MARIRTIKPTFWTSEQVMECSMAARLLFIGLWNFADDCGRIGLTPKTIKAQIFPSDDLDSENILGMIQELSSNGLVIEYEVSGKKYLQITGWQHQRIDKPRKSDIPGPIVERSTNDPRMIDDHSTLESKGKESKGEEGRVDARAPDLVDPVEAEFRRGIVAAFESAKSPNVPDTSQAVIWLKAGYDPGICLAVIAELIRRKPDVSNLKYFERAIDEAHRKKAPPRVTLASERAAAEATIAKKFHVKVDSPQWHAWARHLGKTPPKDSKFGWFFDSEWPPGHDPGSGADRQAELAS